MHLVHKEDPVSLWGNLPGSYRLLVLGCVFIASFGYVWDGYKQKSTNACMQRLEHSRRAAMQNYGKAMKTGSAIDKKLAAQYAGYLAQNSDKACEGL
ncbi:MAG: hypothetical protein HRT94_07195 [Alphaproteobacteria bacterium]|nr:hypothetical protein [Alphaproteobacteria bacterium]